MRIGAVRAHARCARCVRGRGRGRGRSGAGGPQTCVRWQCLLSQVSRQRLEQSSPKQGDSKLRQCSALARRVGVLQLGVAGVGGVRVRVSGVSLLQRPSHSAPSRSLRHRSPRVVSLTKAASKKTRRRGRPTPPCRRRSCRASRRPALFTRQAERLRRRTLSSWVCPGGSALQGGSQKLPGVRQEDRGCAAPSGSRPDMPPRGRASSHVFKTATHSCLFQLLVSFRTPEILAPNRRTGHAPSPMQRRKTAEM